VRGDRCHVVHHAGKDHRLGGENGGEVGLQLRANSARFSRDPKELRIGIKGIALAMAMSLARLSILATTNSFTRSLLAKFLGCEHSEVRK